MINKICPPGPNVLPRTRKNPPHPEKGQQSGAQNNTCDPVSGGDQVAAKVEEFDPPVDGPETDSAGTGEGGQINSSGMAAANEQTSHDNSNPTNETNASKSGGRTQEEKLAGASGRDQVQKPENGNKVNDPPPIAIPQDSTTSADDSQTKTSEETTVNDDSATHVEGNMSKRPEAISTDKQNSWETFGNETNVENKATGPTPSEEDQVESPHSIEEDLEKKAKSVTVQLSLEIQNDDEKDDGGSKTGCGKKADPDDRTKDTATNEEGGQSNGKTPSKTLKDDTTPSSVTIPTEGGAIGRTSGNEIINKPDLSNQTPTDNQSQNPEKNEDNSTSNCDSSASPNSDAIPEEPTELKPPTEGVSTDSAESVEDHFNLLDSRLEQENPGEYRREALNQLLNDWRKRKGFSEIEDDSSFEAGEPDLRVTNAEQENQQKDEAKPTESNAKRHFPIFKTAKERILSLFRGKVVHITKSSVPESNVPDVSYKKESDRD
jgi:hypothetical protein